MSADIGPGDWVECVDDHPHINSSVSPDYRLQKGRLYRIADVRPAGAHPKPRTVYSADAVRLEGDPLPEPYAWRIARFKPVYRPRADLIESLRAPVTRTPKVVRENSREDA